jgi:hypothetical protein
LIAVYLQQHGSFEKSVRYDQPQAPLEAHYDPLNAGQGAFTDLHFFAYLKIWKRLYPKSSFERCLQ